MPDVRDFQRRGPTLLDALGVGSPSGASGVVTGLLYGSKTFDWASIADAAVATTTVTVTGAVLGDHVVSTAMSVSTGGVILHGYVSGSNTVTVVANNETGGAVDMASGTLSVLVAKVSLSA